MTLYIFRCRLRPRKYGATRYETGSNLPAERSSGGWEFYQRVDLGARGTVPFEVETPLLVSQVRRNGFYVWDESPKDVRRTAAVQSKPVLRHENPPVVEPEIAAPDITAPPLIKVVPSVKVAPLTTRVAQARQAEAPVARELESLQRPVTPPVARHQVVWFDIPVRDLDRAIRFYSAVLGAELKKEQAGPGVSMATLPHADGFIGGCLLQNADAKPSESGPLLYLNTHGRLDEAVKAVEMHGGRVLLSRHSIAPFGFRAIVLDSEGNRLALHSND
jgi:predicted enzyme related to lactoylglutathione lyase